MSSLRRIVLVKPQESLHAGWNQRAFAASAKGLLKSAKVKGLEFVEKFPVPAFTRIARELKPRSAISFAHFGPQKVASQTSGPRDDAFAVVGMFDDEEAIARAQYDQDDVLGVFRDPKVEAAPAYCRTGPEGDFWDVRKFLNVSSLAKAKLTGKGVRVAVVDTGIDGRHLGPDGRQLKKQIDSRNYFAPDDDYKPGKAEPDHGTMCAFDVLLAAPQAKLLDFALLRSDGGTWNAFLSDALAAFAQLIELMRRRPGPLVVSNSWGLFDRTDDAPVGSPENYSANANHPFNQIVGALVSAGADVLFAAGNCGQQCPDGRCGKDDVGPGASIHGANSHPSVVTVAAATVKADRLGYSSQGPGDLADRKPDIAAYSHFAGSGVYRADGGTSAACPVAAGVVAALRQGNKKLSAAAMKGVVQRSAVQTDGAWNYDIGYGIIDAGAALALMQTGSVAQAKKTTPSKSMGRAWFLEPVDEATRASYQANVVKKKSGARSSAKRNASKRRP